MVKNSILKILATLLIVSLNWSGILAVIETIAYYNDTEISSENTLSAGTLDVALDPAGVYASGLMYPTDTAATSVGLSISGSLATQYASKIIPLTANTDPCLYVYLDVTDGTQTYSGKLLDFVSVPAALEGSVNWNYGFTIGSSAPPSVWNKTCYFKWVFTAWSKDVTEPIGGFVDIEEKSGGIRIGKAVVLNEILANPVGLDNALKPDGEWVELYNNSNINIDVNGWVVYDSDDSHELYITSDNTNTGDTVVPAQGFLVVYRDGDADFTINNDVETIRLYTGYPVSSAVLVDSYSYTTEKPEGFSYARIPDGVGAWVDPIPTPGGPNKLEEVSSEEEQIIEEEEQIFGGIPINEETILEEEITEEQIEEQTEETTNEEIIEEIINEEQVSEEPVEEIIPTEETEETVSESGPEVVEEQLIIEEVPIIEETIEETVEEPASESNTPAPEESSVNEEIPPDETPTIEEEPVIEEEPEPEPIIEEQPANIPDNDSGQAGDTGDDSGSDSGSGGDGGSGDSGPEVTETGSLEAV